MTKKQIRILVAGGAGFIGSNFIRFMLAKHKNIQILNFDKLTYSGNLDNLRDIKKDQRYKFIKGDIADKSELERAWKNFKPNYVIDFAAETHVDRSIHISAKEFVLTNVLGVLNFLDLLRGGRVKKFVEVSTDEVFGSLPLKSKMRFTETTRRNPNTPYAATKGGGDLLCAAYYSTWKVPVVVTNCSNNYGPYQYPEKIIPYFITRMMENKKLPLYGDGKYVRDWIHVLDHCRALELCLFKGKPGEFYNIGANNERSNLEIARKILKYFKRDESWLEFVGDRPGHDRRYSLDSGKIRAELGWRPQIQFDDGFKETADWYMKNLTWVNNVRKKTGVFNPHIDLWKEHHKPLLFKK